jgi:hypothetical protein
MRILLGANTLAYLPGHSRRKKKKDFFHQNTLAYFRIVVEERKKDFFHQNTLAYLPDCGRRKKEFNDFFTKRGTVVAIMNL